MPKFLHPTKGWRHAPSARMLRRAKPPAAKHALASAGGGPRTLRRTRLLFEARGTSYHPRPDRAQAPHHLHASRNAQ